MDVQAQLDAAKRRIVELEKELERYRRAERFGPSSTSAVKNDLQKSCVLTRSAAAAAAAVALQSGKGDVVMKEAAMATLEETTATSRPASDEVEGLTEGNHHGLKIRPLSSAHVDRFGKCTEMSGACGRQKLDFAKSDKPSIHSARPRRASLLKAPHPILAAACKPMDAADLLGTKDRSGHDRCMAVSTPLTESENIVPASRILSPVSDASLNAGLQGSEQTGQSQSGNSQGNAQPNQSAPRRRPPPLPTITKSSTKKERCTLVAKCTEPRQGQTRYWTDEEHERFLEAVAEYGEKAYVAISNYVETRTPKQVRTHAQKFQMKMARLAKQSYEAGQPIQLPPGMLPIYPKFDAQNKSASVDESDGSAHAKGGPKGEERAKFDVSTMPRATQHMQDIPLDMRQEDADTAEVPDLIAEAASSVSDVSSPDLTDPYLNYIGGDGHGEEDAGLEDSFAAKLSKTFHGDTPGAGAVRTALIVPQEQLRAETTSVNTHEDDDDDLEDLEDCGELPIASLGNFGM